MSQLIKWGTVVSAITVAGVVALLFFRPKAPHTLHDALMSRPEVFSASQLVLAPIAAADRLGYRLAAHTAAATKNGNTVAETEPSPCFYVRPEASPGVTNLSFQYEDEAAAMAEVGSVFGTFGISATSSGHATALLKDLNVSQGLGVPNLNGPCGTFDDSEGFAIITKEVVARSFLLTTSGSDAVDAGSNERKGPTTVSANSSWRASGSNGIEGSNIVISGSLTDVTATATAPVRVRLEEPIANRVKPLPVGFDGHVTVVSYDDRTLRLSLRLDGAAMYSEIPAPTDAKFRACPTDTDVTLDVGRVCYFWLQPGNAAVAIWWELEQDKDTKSRFVTLVTRGYRTNYAKGAPH